MRTDADDPARVRDPAIELLLSHTATLTDEWCSRPWPVGNGLRADSRRTELATIARSGAARSRRDSITYTGERFDYPISSSAAVTLGTVSLGLTL